jgi:hypothetical protein
MCFQNESMLSPTHIDPLARLCVRLDTTTLVCGGAHNFACGGGYQKLRNSQKGEMGPIQAKLLEFGARDGSKQKAVDCFVLGAFGELPNSLYSLCTAIVLMSAQRGLGDCN